MKANWTDILWSRICVHCLSRRTNITPFRRAFCPLCTSRLPATIVWHLDTATRSAWFMLWWQVAMKRLRTEDMKRDRAGAYSAVGQAAHAHQ